MFSKQVVLTMIILIGITGFAGTTTSADTQFVCSMNSNVPTVVTDEIVAGLPVPVNLDFACLNNLSTAQGTVQITTTNLQGANSSSNPALLILNGIAYTGQTFQYITTFDVPVPNGAFNFSVTNFLLDPTNGTPFVPIVATGTVSTSGTTATSPGATVGIFGQSGNDATGIVDVNNLKLYAAAKFNGDTYATSWSVIRPVAGGNHYLSLDNAQDRDTALLTSPPRARFNNLSLISQWTLDRSLLLIPDFRWSRDNNSRTGVGVFDPNDQPDPLSPSFELTRIIPNLPLSSTNAPQAVAGSVGPASYETQLFANLNSYAPFYLTLQVGGPPVTRNSAYGGSSVDVCEAISGDIQCTTNFAQYQFQSMVLNGAVMSTVKNGFSSLPMKYRVQLIDLEAITPHWDMTWNMNICGEVKTFSTTSMDSELRLNGFAKGSFTMQGNSTPYELKKFDFLVRLNEDRTTGSTTYNARGWTYNSCTRSLVNLKATNFIFSPQNSISGGELRVNNAIDSNNSVDALFNPNGDGKVQISSNGIASPPIDQNALFGGCVIPVTPPTNVFIQSLDLTFTSFPTYSVINVTGSISTTSTTGNTSGATVHLTLTGGQTAAVTTDLNGNFSAAFTIFAVGTYTVAVSGVDPPSGEVYDPSQNKISSVTAFVN
ncbi:MAG: hypothetical protein ACHQ0Y_07695 [Thermodesulfovibrionales bacterium]